MAIYSTAGLITLQVLGRHSTLLIAERVQRRKPITDTPKASNAPVKKSRDSLPSNKKNKGNNSKEKQNYNPGPKKSCNIHID